MADYKELIPIIKKWEGGYVNDPDDRYLRIAPSFPPVEELIPAMEGTGAICVICLHLGLNHVWMLTICVTLTLNMKSRQHNPTGLLLRKSLQKIEIIYQLSHAYSLMEKMSLNMR